MSETGSTTSRSEHLQWCKDRALELVDAGDLNEAFSSMQCDMLKHDKTRDAALLAGELGMMLIMGGHLKTAQQMRDWINGFN